VKEDLVMKQTTLPKHAHALAAMLLVLAAAPAARAQLDPLLPQAFFTAPCPNPGSAGSVVPGRDLWKIPVAPSFPDALCNDGTRAVFYVRRYADDAYRNHWHIHLQGGGNCTTAQSCADRWCSVDTNFGAKQMSTTGTPPRIRARGIFDRSSRNSFRLWNHVLVYYCSSDSWSGQASDVAVVADDPATGVSTAYRIHFRGATIVDAVRDQLRRDCGGALCPCPAYSYGPDGDGDGCPDFQMPDLDEARYVLFSGSSAGSGGVRVLADAFGASLRAQNVNCQMPGVCPLDYRAVIDAGIGPDTDGKDYDTACGQAGWCDPACVAAGTCEYQDYMVAFGAQAHAGLWNARPEDSCQAWHADPANDPNAETWRCEDYGYLAVNHLTTPYFVRTDLQDELLTKNYREAGFGLCPDFAGEVEAQHRALFDPICPLDCSAAEGSVQTPGNPPLVTPGVFAPQGTDHVGLTDRRPFFRVRLPCAAPANQCSFHDTLRNWFAGAGPQQLVATYNPAGPAPSYCP
jgi:hypothetical protein